MNFIQFCLFMLFNLRRIWSQDVAPTIQPLSVNNASDILENVLQGYRDEVGPIINGEPVNVAVNLFINDMVPINKADMHFSLDFYLRLQWLDPRLSFNASSKNVFIPFANKFYQEIWSPNLYFPNGKKGFIHPLTKPNIFVKVHSDGRVYFSERLSLVSFCAMNMSYYPFDIQKCEVTIEDYSNPIEYLRLKWMHPATEKAHHLYSTDFAQIKLAHSNRSRVGDFGHVFDRLELQISLYRDIQLYILRDFLPCILIVMMSWVTFWINYKSIPARVCLGITTVLTIVSMTNSVQKVNPISNTLRSIDVFLLICLIFVFGALLELAITGMADPHGSAWWKRTIDGAEDGLEGDKDDPKGTVNSSIGPEEGNGKNRLMKLLTVRPAKRNAIFPVADSSTGTEDPLKEKRKFVGPFVFVQGEQHIVDRYAKIFFPTLFSTFLIIFFLFHYLHPDTVGGVN